MQNYWSYFLGGFTVLVQQLFSEILYEMTKYNYEPLSQLQGS